MPLTLENTFTQLENFGHSLRAAGYRLRPGTIDEIYEAFDLARQACLTVTARGAGRSYNDASLNGGGIVLDLSGLNQILEWDPATGVVRCQPGVTLRQLWQKVLPDGWWPPVVSGTMHTTLGGCLSTNIHGKNNYRAGTIGEHVLEFRAILPTGQEIRCTPQDDPGRFYAFISGLGMLGIFTSITLQMKKMYSGLLQVHAWPTPNVTRHLRDLEEGAPNFDYIVGWMDTINVGHSQIHAANYLPEGKDPRPHETMQLQRQILPDRILGVMPNTIVRHFMAPFVNNLGWRAVNNARYITAQSRHSFLQPHAAFHFLLDYIPGWERSFGRGGLIQHQSFLPRENAVAAWTEMLKLANRRSLPPYLGVTKRHRPDRFLISHAVDGFSLALDFKVTDGNRRRLREMLQEFDRIVIEAGGRFYFAKNSDTSAETTRRFLGDEAIAAFKHLKQRCDPQGLLESDLYRRVFAAQETIS
jgi:decaprenylphospho-beta-D-ribofuranose 2-oxidase